MHCNRGNMRKAACPPPERYPRTILVACAVQVQVRICNLACDTLGNVSRGSLLNLDLCSGLQVQYGHLHIHLPHADRRHDNSIHTRQHGAEQEAAGGRAGGEETSDAYHRAEEGKRMFYGSHISLLVDPEVHICLLYSTRAHVSLFCLPTRTSTDHQDADDRRFHVRRLLVPLSHVLHSDLLHGRTNFGGKATAYLYRHLFHGFVDEFPLLSSFFLRTA